MLEVQGHRKKGQREKRKIETKREQERQSKSLKTLGCGCGTVGRAVASDTRDPWFESQHWQLSILNVLNCQLQFRKDIGLDRFLKTLACVKLTNKWSRNGVKRKMNNTENKGKCKT